MAAGIKAKQAKARSSLRSLIIEFLRGSIFGLCHFLPNLVSTKYAFLNISFANCPNISINHSQNWSTQKYQNSISAEINPLEYLCEVCELSLKVFIYQIILNLQQSSSFMLLMSYYDAGRQAKENNSSMGVVWQQLLLWTAIMEYTFKLLSN